MAKKEYKKVLWFELAYCETEKGDFSINIGPADDGLENKYKKKAKLKVLGGHSDILFSAFLIENMIHQLGMNKIQEKELIQSVLERVKILKENRIGRKR